MRHARTSACVHSAAAEDAEAVPCRVRQLHCHPASCAYLLFHGTAVPLRVLSQAPWRCWATEQLARPPRRAPAVLFSVARGPKCRIEPVHSCPQLPGILALLGRANEPASGHAAAVLRCCARQGELVHRLEPALPRLLALLREPRPRTAAARQVWATQQNAQVRQGCSCAASALPLVVVLHRKPQQHMPLAGHIEPASPLA